MVVLVDHPAVAIEVELISLLYVPLISTWRSGWASQVRASLPDVPPLSPWSINEWLSTTSTLHAQHMSCLLAERKATPSTNVVFFRSRGFINFSLGVMFFAGGG